MTNVDDCTQKLEIHGLSEDIVKMSATENVKNPKLAFSITWLNRSNLVYSSIKVSKSNVAANHCH